MFSDAFNDKADDKIKFKNYIDKILSDIEKEIILY